MLERPPLSGRHVLCDRRTGREHELSRKLGREQGRDDVTQGNFRLVGHYLAYSENRSGPRLETEDVVVLRRSPSARLITQVDAADEVSGLAVSKVGQLAWINRDPTTDPFADPVTLQVKRVADDGTPVILDSGTNIDPDSFRLSKTGRSVVWTHSGASRSARLEGPKVP
ncbi:hypothetical protein LRS13_12720 [Svornostia abyssi]|uniref:Uncharacterized protein n=1 Tax=Svornostia abyssi TaxID=2898438 RepID=A0ABY5PAJ5_9ACTN|nr:hypothetical protein LRS13_12720 [Parviterribacteraceae bacterium J379]